MSLISIIIPAFNIDKFLVACLNSIIDQISSNVEIIIVDDGSTDETGEIANQFAYHYDNIKVIHQTNQGVSAARNKGLLESKGQYIWFVDGDDIINTHSIKFLIYTINKYQTDIVFFSYEEFFNKLKKIQIAKLRITDVCTNNEFISRLPVLIKEEVLTYSPWSKIVKRKLLLEHDILFDTNLTYSEDYYWNYQVFKVIDTFAHTDQVLYFYRKSRAQSATTQLSVSHLQSALQALKLSVDDMLLNYGDSRTLPSLLLYSSQTFFYILPEFYKAKQLNDTNMATFHDLYHIYQRHNVELDSHNTGSRVFEIIYKQLPWYHTVRIYSLVVGFRRRVQLYRLNGEI